MGTEKKTRICETWSFNIEDIATCSKEHPAKDLHQEWDSKCECHKVKFQRAATLTCEQGYIG